MKKENSTIYYFTNQKGLMYSEKIQAGTRSMELAKTFDTQLAAEIYMTKHKMDGCKLHAMKQDYL